MTLLLGLYLVVGCSLLVVGRATGGRRLAATALAAVPMAATLGWLISIDPADLMAGADSMPTAHWSWVDAAGLAVDLRLDGLAAVMTALVGGLGLGIVIYAHGYFGADDTHGPRRLGLLVLFAASMLGVVWSDHLVMLYGAWELTSITSFLLIGERWREAAGRRAAMHALLVTGAGALVMLGGFVALGVTAGTWRISEIVADPPTGSTVTLALIAIAIGAFTKSAQFPFHGWLPGAMVAPTPVSAYLHSATMVKAGVYLLARLAPLNSASTTVATIIVAVGLVTMFVGGIGALRQHDLKALLAYGTISQLGLMVALTGTTTPPVVALVVMVLAHGVFKAALFMVAGNVEHHTGTRDIRLIGRHSPRSPLVSVTAVVAAASMAGIPLTFGFIAKESALEASAGHLPDRLGLLVAVAAGSVLTVAYSLRFLAGIGGWCHETAEPAASGHGPSVAAWAPGVVLVAVTIVFGIRPGLLDDWVTAADTLGTGAVHLALWHGWTTALAVSMAVLVVGTGLGVALTRRPATAATEAATTAPVAEPAGDAEGADATPVRAYERTLSLLDRGARRVTRFTQPGSLPIYAAVILAVAAAVPGLVLVGRNWDLPDADWVETPLHLGAAAAIAGFALAAAAVHRRFSAALFLGMTGYAMAGLFVIQGAPDLALTQVAIETLSTVLFVLVLRSLPDRFTSERGRQRRGIRAVIAAAIGAMVFVFTLSAGAEGPATTVSNTMIVDSVPEAHGHNVVNVILVDLRGLDTLGEICVLAAAAVGTVALARAGRPRRPASPTPRTAFSRHLAVDETVNLIVPVLMLVSLWLLFAGHNQPGGGFAGGIVAAAAVSLRYVAGGIAEVRRASRRKPWTVLGAGVLIAALTAAAPLVFGGDVLESGYASFDVPLIGTMSLVSPMLFDIGVYIAVLGLALMVFESFGDELTDRELDEARL